jgi:hypothetical protein
LFVQIVRARSLLSELRTGKRSHGTASALLSGA